MDSLNEGSGRGGKIARPLPPHALAACFGKLLHSSIILLAKDVHHPTDYTVQARYLSPAA
eukprot:scaffold16612_cov109-Skeletonema_dohrnii-CCMP3373.AAC.5